MKKIDNLSINKIDVTNIKSETKGIITAPQEIPKKISIKRSPANWVELRRECQDADEYSKWLEDLENDIHLTTLEKKQIKATI